ncbi:MAG: tetratricopeptide repeat protein [Victivallales bacterium]|nr:tetratricopeptide repeat protein [Victivallales bacterium]
MSLRPGYWWCWFTPNTGDAVLRHIGKTIISVCVLVGVAFAATAGDVGGNRDRLLGDEAFNAGDYALATKFYVRYMEAVPEGSQAWVDTALALGTSYLRAGNIARASAVYEQIIARVGDKDDIGIKLLHCEILVAEQKYSAARLYAENIIFSMIAEGEDYNRILHLLGFVLEKEQKWLDAANIYALLENAGAGSDWRYTALCRRVYSLIMGGSYEDAWKVLSGDVAKAGFSDKPEIQALGLLLLVKEKRYEEFRDVYLKVRIGVPDKANAMMFEILSDAIAHFVALKDYKTAIQYSGDAYIFAAGTADRVKTLRSLINMNITVEDYEAAVAECRKYIQLYGDTDDIHVIKKQLAVLLTRMGNYDEAVRVYTAMVDDASLDMSIRVAAAEGAGSILADRSDFGRALKMFDFIRMKATDNDAKAKGDVLRAKVYFKQEMYDQVIEALKGVPDISPRWSAEALYWTMRAWYMKRDYIQSLALLDRLEEGAGSEPWISADSLYYRACIMENTGNLSDACETFVRYSTLYPDANHAMAALFRAGDLALKERRFAEAAEIFDSFTRRYSASELTPAAYYKRIYALFCAGEAVKASEEVHVLAGRFPQDKYTVAAFFWLVDFYRDRDDMPRVIEVLEEIRKRYAADSATVSRSLYEQAYILFRQGEDKPAESLLEKMLKDHPDSPDLSRAYYLLGDIHSDRGAFKTALENYQLCLKSNPSADLENACRGRLGDCYMSLYNKDQDVALLDLAIVEYRLLSSRELADITVRNQTLYKLGKCYELRKEFKSALEIYKELIYGYRLDARKYSHLKPVWVYKAAHSAIDIYVADKTPKAAKAAVRIYKLLESMNLDTGDDYKIAVERLQKKYNF